MIVIERNGKTVVLTGWRAWLAGTVAFVLVWALLAVAALIVVGVGLTLSLLVMLTIPAIAGVALLSSVFSRRR